MLRKLILLYSYEQIRNVYQGAQQASLRHYDKEHEGCVMEAISFAIGVIDLVMLPLLLWYIKRKLEKFDGKREQARIDQAEAERKAVRQRDAERRIVLAITRTMLLDNYEKCMDKGYYSLEEREVYSKLYESYKEDDGNGIIDTIAVRIRELPTEPTKSKGV